MGGLVGLDAVSCVQAMISRPIVAGSLAGALLGEPASGIWAGGLLEIFSLRQLPIGASRVWDTGPAAVVAAMAAASAGGPAALLVGSAYGIVIAWLGGWSVHGLRHLNAGLVAGNPGAISTPSRLALRHVAALGIDFLRAAVLTLVGVALFAWLMRLPEDGGPKIGGESLATYVVLGAAALMMGADLRVMVRGRSVAYAFAGGALVGTVIALWVL